MASLTTRQRDLINFLLTHPGPIVVSDIARQMELTPRQVTYSLKGVRSWLQDRDVELRVTPGIGIELLWSEEEQDSIKNELFADANFQLVLSVGQRQQLFTLNLLISDEPLILFNLQQVGQVSRTTILKDLEGVGEWVLEFGLNLERRPNYGIWISGPERNKRQALAALLWGDIPFDDSLWQMTHVDGLKFGLSQDAHLMPILEEVNALVEKLNTKAMMSLVATAEASLGGRFSDQGVLHLALAIAILAYRIDEGQFLNFDHISDFELDDHPVWAVAQQLLRKLYVNVDAQSLQAETTMIAILLLSCAKSDRYPGDLETDFRFPALIEMMMKTIGEAYELEELSGDATLRDGLIANVLPACHRKRFRVWTPVPIQSDILSNQKYAFENQLSRHLADEIDYATGIKLSTADITNLAFLLRAAYIRERPYQLREVVVVCPSGMATAQLLMARLKARFPRLGNVTVISMREVDSERLREVDLIITTVPLAGLDTAVDIIQVHPQLLPEDVSRITEWLA